MLPGDLRIRWMLNLAYMTLGEYPQMVPPQYLIPLNTFESKVDVGRFRNVAPLVGLTSRGPNQAGGSVFDATTLAVNEGIREMEQLVARYEADGAGR